MSQPTEQSRVTRSNKTKTLLEGLSSAFFSRKKDNSLDSSNLTANEEINSSLLNNTTDTPQPSTSKKDTEPHILDLDQSEDSSSSSDSDTDNPNDSESEHIGNSIFYVSHIEENFDDEVNTEEVEDFEEANEQLHNTEEIQLNTSHTGSLHSLNTENFDEMDSMPKYTQKLSKKALSLFLTNYQLWGKYRKIDDKALKLNLPLAMMNSTAQQWLNINMDILTDDAKSFDNLKTKMTNECPMEEEDQCLGILDVLARKQPEDEKASLFIQRMRFHIGEEFSKYDEQDIISSMVKQLNVNLRRYIECRGHPTTYNELIKIVQDYEMQGGPFEQEVKIKQEPIGMNWATMTPIYPTQQNFKPNTFMTPTLSNAPVISQTGLITQPTSFDVQILKDKIEELSKEVLAVKQVSVHSNNGISNGNQGNNAIRGNYRGRGNFRGNRNFNNVPQCHYCGKNGHVMAVCYSRQRNENSRQWVPRGRGNFRGNNNNGYRRNNYQNNNYNTDNRQDNGNRNGNNSQGNSSGRAD